MFKHLNLEVYKIGKIITNYSFVIKQELLRSILLFSLEWNEYFNKSTLHGSFQIQTVY